ncbi:haloacid dehalogenase type II [Paralcaligenes sp. KSB-10]|uniref:haloacid dehalogenase type II n=1 Tax=Paralcaligenes sp. KSB-10 TaxID=2901142 RepID=UPI001E539420|nr:haloacid dehalogenase type II [Paralcaligenes sp. KSB-10]UHL64480.1 haloacid dehalogenase type II [Paralcaligenes sp. KSB-10]
MVGIESVKALVFDTFGTVVDWRASIAREMAEFGAAKGIQADWLAFADAWRAGYVPAMDGVRSGRRVWANIDVLHRERLNELLGDFGLSGLSETEIQHVNKVWHRLNPWPDSVPGLTRLKRRYIISTFSNGSVACLVGMAKHGEIPWDAVFSADVVRHFKPDPEIYLGVQAFFDLRPHEVMLVAAHNNDLRHGRLHGMRTAYINRPTEYGPDQKKDLNAEEDWDLAVGGIDQLADILLAGGH